MDKIYQEVDFGYCGTLKDAVEKLEECRDNGILAYGTFNGHILHSDTVTLDDAYIKIVGTTYAELEEKQKKWRGDRDKAEREFQENLPNSIERWKARARTILPKDKLEYWDTIVPIRANDLYQGMELDQCLDLVEMLNNRCSLDEAKTKVESQNHSGMSFGLICQMVSKFSDRGQEFVEYVR